MTQRTTHGQQVFTSRVVETALFLQTEPTGAWFAHEKGGQLLLDRLTLRKDDGEDTVLVLDGSAILEGLPPDGSRVARPEEGARSPSGRR